MKLNELKISKETVDKLFSKQDIDILGYESPINVIAKQLRMEKEANIVKAVQEYGIDVNKDELVKALQYDRNQYEKGYVNGYCRKASDVAREIFEEIEGIRLKHIKKCEFFRNGSTEEMERKFYEGAEWGLRQLSHWFAELKKKYTEEITEGVE